VTPSLRSVGALALALGAFATASSVAMGEEPPADSSEGVTRLARALEASRGPDTYTALRELWSAWDVEDPTDVEAALARYAADPSRPASPRAYAGMLAAYARRRRGDLDGADRRIAALGFVRDWLIVGPFENQNRTGLGEPFRPELELDEPIVFDRGYQGKERPVVWRPATDAARLGWLDLGSLVRPSKDVCVFATTFVASPRDRRATVFVGATGAFKLFFDAEAVLADGGYRELDAERYAAPVMLKAGEFHRLTAKVCGASNSPSFTLRLADEHGAPLEGVTVEATERASALAARRLRQSLRSEGPSESVGARPTTHHGSEIAGAIQAFDRLLAASHEAPASLEAYARYLFATGGDAEDDHRARDFAERAARDQPTVERLLLAGEFAEDRNGRRVFVDDAERLLHTKPQRIAWLRAKARLVRTGPSSHDALPLYRELLRLDRHDTVGRLGLVDRLVEAGLPRTALEELMRELEVRPRSLALLRAASAELRVLGRDAEAEELEARHTAYRFDDPSVLQRNLERAGASRDLAKAQRWASWLLRVEPTSPWAHTEVAKHLRAVGDVEGASRTYRAFLALVPEDAAVLRSLADLEFERGHREAALDLLRAIVRLTPQDTAARDYLERLVPKKTREDERYAWPEERFRALAAAPPEGGEATRVLRKLHVTTVFDSGLASHFHQRVFQPLTEEAAKRARRFAFAYHGDRQLVELRGVRVFRKDGRIDETVTTGEGPLDDPSINMYTLERVFYVQLPELHAGDVVELRYRVDDVSVQSDMADYVAEIETMGEVAPVSNAEYVFSAPARRKLTSRVTGLSGVRESVESMGERTVRRFEAARIPGAVSEPSAPPLAETLGYIHTSSLDDWASVGRWYWGLAKEKLTPDEDVRRVAEAVTRGKPDVASRVAAVYKFVASETRYVALEFGIEGIRPRRASLTLARGWGDCKDKAALLVAMLGALGIDAELVLVRTGMRGRFDATVPSLVPFDHAIAYVPSLDLYLDGTAEATGSTELPAMDRGALALRISEGQGKLVELPNDGPVPTKEEQELALELESGGGVRFSGTLSSQGFEASAWRQRYHSDSTRRERVRADLAALLGPLELDANGVETSDLDALESPVSLRVRGRATAERDGIAWSVTAGRRTHLVASLAPLAVRTSPLLVGPPRTAVERWTVSIPSGARILGLPSEVRLLGPGARFTSTVEVNGRQIVVKRTLELRQTRIEPREYGAFREFCRGVDAAGAPRVLVAR